MLLDPLDAEQFFKLHRALMWFVNNNLNIIPNISTPEEFSSSPLEAILEVRDAFLEEMDLIESFVNDNPADLNEDEIEIVLSWHHAISGQFYIFRQLKNFMVFLSTNKPVRAYGVVAFTETFEEILGPSLPRLVDTVLLPFKGKIVYDGLLRGYNIHFGGGITRNLNDEYREAKERLGIVTSLPVSSFNQSQKKTSQKKKKATTAAKDVKPVLDEVISMTDEFCQEHLNEEYADLCRKLAEKVSRKRPSPLLRGRTKTWACGIIRTIGWVNFLDDRTTQPHMKLTAIDKALGVGESTGQGKSMEIRKMLKIHPFDMDWTLPSRMEDNLMGWMVEVNGI
ncbi:MAG: hypothetical protein KDA84_10925, partial [Planctomycetaceae bacterium]|nr:hypothetical protein [Planctomycetaceae bacterium]